MFTGRRFDYETGLYYYRARYYNPYIGRFLQTDPIGYSAGMNLYTYCRNNPLNLVDPSGLASFSYSIPTMCITDSPSTNNAFIDVNSFLMSFDFWKKNYPGWRLSEVELVDGNYYKATFISDDDVENKPNFGKLNVGGFPVLLFDKTGLLTDRLLNKIIKPKITEINDWSKWNPYHLWELMWLDTPFSGKDITDPDISFSYGGGVWKGYEINYIAQGHAHRHMGLDPLESTKLVVLHNIVILYGSGLIVPDLPTPTREEIMNKILWTQFGYNTYNERKDW